MKTVVLIVALLSACNPYELEIDYYCGAEEIEALHEAVERINEVFEECGLDDRIELIGIVKTDQDGAFEDRDEPTFFCLPEDSPIVQAWPESRVGWGDQHGDIAIVPSRIPGEILLHMVMHELGHFVSAAHIDDYDSVMSGSDARATEYNESDRAEICGGK